MRIFTKTHIKIVKLIAVILIVGMPFACKKTSDKRVAIPFDPSIATTIQSFTPDSGGVSTQLIIQGTNFGSDTSLIKVFINDKPAPVIGAKGEYIYALVPSRAGTGELKLVMGKDGDTKEIVADHLFTYNFNPSVSTLSGFTDQDGKTAIVDGPIDKAQFEEPYWLAFDNHKNLYILEEYRGLRMIDSALTTVSTLLEQAEVWTDPGTLGFNPTFDTLYITNDQWDINGLGTAVATPANGFTTWNTLVRNNTTNGGAAQPQTGDYFYNSYEKGEVYKWNRQTKTSEFLFRVDDVNWEFDIQFAPSGDFAYLVVINQSYILKSKYNRTTGKLEAPVHFVGAKGGHGYKDGVGTDARFDHPQQGAFDEEDNFYLCDVMNFCIRKISPTGIVTTFAGRPGQYGYADGALRDAQFDRPQGIVYDPSSGTFFIADQKNRRIRMIMTE